MFLILVLGKILPSGGLCFFKKPAARLYDMSFATGKLENPAEQISSKSRGCELLQLPAAECGDERSECGDYDGSEQQVSGLDGYRVG